MWVCACSSRVCCSGLGKRRQHARPVRGDPGTVMIATVTSTVSDGLACAVEPAECGEWVAAVTPRRGTPGECPSSKDEIAD